MALWRAEGVLHQSEKVLGTRFYAVEDTLVPDFKRWSVGMIFRNPDAPSWAVFQDEFPHTRINIEENHAARKQAQIEGKLR